LLLSSSADAAADDDELRLEQIRERGDPARERLTRLAPDLHGDGIAGTRGGRDVGRGHVCHPRLLRPLGDRRSRGVGLEAATAAATAALPAVPVDRDVPELAAVARGAAVEPVV